MAGAKEAAAGSYCGGGWWLLEWHRVLGRWQRDGSVARSSKHTPVLEGEDGSVGKGGHCGF